MRFAFLIFKYFPFGGVQRDMLRIARELVRSGHTVDIYTMSWEGDLPEAGITAHLVKAGGLLNHKRYESFIRRAQAEVKNGDFDLVVGFNRMAGLDAYFAADPCFEERARSERGLFYRLLSRYKSFAAAERAVFNANGKCEIMILTPDAKTVFRQWYGTSDSRFHLLPPYLSAERMALKDRTEMRTRVRLEFGLTAEDRILLMVGSGFRTKGLDRAILGLASLPAELRSKTHLIAVGQDNPKVFERLSIELGLAAQVHISSGRSDIPQLMQGADLLIHPAHHEMAGHVILEAMASGLPVLPSAVCGYAFHVKQAQAGRLVPTPFQQHEFNRLLREMLTSDKLEMWRENGLSYTQDMMKANDGGAEAAILVTLAERKKTKKDVMHALS